MPRPSRCQTWPDCGCSRRWKKWQALSGEISEWPPLSEEELQWMHTELVWMLSCVSQYCPDRSKRDHATVQLMRPIFAREARKWMQ